MGKTCTDLFAGIDCTVIGNADEEVGGIAYRSDRVQPGDAFFCIVGLTADGHSFAQDAIDRGAKVLVVERKVYLADATDVTEVVVADTRKAMAAASANFYDHPSKDFALVGITGTNGKTTTTYLVEHIAHVAGKRTGVIGTVGVRIGGEQEKTAHTTPESPDLQKLLARMRDERCGVVAMEVSSHALDLERTWGTTFAVTAFSNLTQDHLDYHHTFEAYFEAKARLFGKDYPARRVICIDDKWGRELLRRCATNEDSIVTTGFDAAAQIHPVDVRYAPTHTEVELDVRGSRHRFRYPLVGKFNVENVMCAFGIGLQLGIPADVIVEALEEAPQIPGRLERVSAPCDGGIAVFVDYAHTPDALEKALSSIMALTHRLRVRLRRRPRRVEALHHGQGRARGRLRRGDERQPAPRGPAGHHRRHRGRHGLGRGALRRGARPPRGHRAGAGMGRARRLRAHRGQGPRGLPAGGRRGAVLRRPHRCGRGDAPAVRRPVGREGR